MTEIQEKNWKDCGNGATITTCDGLLFDIKIFLQKAHHDGEIFTRTKIKGSGVLRRILLRNALHTLQELVLHDDKVSEILTRYANELKIERNDYGIPFYNSFMKERFHPPGKPDFLKSKSLMRDLEWISKKSSISDFPTEFTNVNIREWLDEAWKVIGIISIEKYIRISNRDEEKKRGAKPTLRHVKKKKYKPRKTCKAKFHLVAHKELKRTNSPFQRYPDRLRAIKAISRIEGRFKLWKDAWLTATALPIAKVGLVSTDCNQFVNEICSNSWNTFSKEYPATYSLLVICTCVFSERKAFTLNSQKQGGLNKYMEELLSIILEKETDGLKVVALFLPIDTVYSKITQEHAIYIYNQSMKILKQFSGFLDEQWNKGVKKSVSRLCRVLPKGSGVNSSGYNAVADAFMNLRRFQTISAKYAKIDNAPIILKVMQLIANDQFHMAQGKVNSNAYVYKELTKNGILPWKAIVNPESFDTRKALTVLFQACKEHKCSIESWIGAPKQRSAEITNPVDMICGVAVPPMHEETANYLKDLGIFGSGPWTGI